MLVINFTNIKNQVIISTEHTLGGSPRLNGRRLDVNHVIFGITEYDNGGIESYQGDFEVTTEQLKHAILYCKDEICEVQDVPRSCNGCSKKFQNDIKTWEEYIQLNGGIKETESSDPIFKLGDHSILLGALEDHKKDFEGKDNWKRAAKLHESLREKLKLPDSYTQLINL